MDISERKATWFIEAIHCSIRTRNNTALKTQQCCFNWQKEEPGKTTTQASGVSKQEPPASCPPVTQLEALYMGPICEALPWRMSSAHSKSHICAVQVSEAQWAFKTIMQIRSQCHPVRLAKACASSLIRLSCATRPSSAPLNPRAMKHGTRYCGLTLMTPEHLCAQEYSLPYWHLKSYWNKQGKESHRTLLTLPIPAGSTCTSFSIFTFSHST